MAECDVSDDDWLAARFEEHRARLNALAYRMLGSRTEAEDTVQDAWLRVSRSDATGVANLGGWLRTVVSRLCLNVLQSRRARPEVPFDLEALEPIASQDERSDPEQEALLADSIGLALHIVLDTLTPSERVAFVLHDMFEVPFEEIAPILDRRAAATRQLASRARRRVHQVDTSAMSDRARHYKIVDAFLAASKNRDFVALLQYLDPSVVLRADQAAVALGAVEVRGSEQVARSFVGKLGGAKPAMVNGSLGAVWIPGGQPRVVFTFEVSGERITAVELIADRERLQELELDFETG